MTDYYHCTSKRAGLAIERSGFRNSPSKNDMADYFQEFRRHFPTDEVRAVFDLWSETNDRPFVEAGAKLWNKRFGHGTVLWVSETPDVTYGDSCFRFMPPKSAIMVPVSGENDYFLIWVPMKPIPAKHFTLLSDEELEAYPGEYP